MVLLHKCLVLVVSLSVVGVLIAIIGLAAGVVLWTGYRHIKSKRLKKERREIIAELEDLNSSVKSSIRKNGIGSLPHSTK